MRFIGHAGLAAGRPGGTPTRQTLAVAEQLRVDWIEIDVCCAADGTLLLRHDLTLPSGRQVRSLDAAQVRREDPEALTADEAAEILEQPAMPQVLVDLKDARDAHAVGLWLGTRPSPQRWAVCSDDPQALRALRDTAPGIERWLGVPRVIQDRAEPIRRITAMALRSLLPGRLDRLVTEVGAAALTVDRWAITPALVARAHELRLPVAAWTVNAAPLARRMAAQGVDLLTTDHPAEMRAALAAQDGAVTGRCDG